MVTLRDGLWVRLDGHGAALARRPARRRPPNIPGVDVPAFQLPPELADADTVGIVYDEIDGLTL
jgi:hypothetical protein